MIDMKEIRTYSTNTEINSESYKPAFTLINPDAKEDYLLDGRYVVKAPKRGRWLTDGYDYRCSQCGLYVGGGDIPKTMKYCPNCGARMMDEVTE